MDPTFDIARNFVNTNYEDLPPEAVEGAKKSILDSLGVGLAGASCEGIQELTELLTGFGGEKQSTVIASGGIQMPVIFTVQVNASMMHALDFDDSINGAQIHAGCIITPVCFGMAEYLGKLSGQEFITAAALGTDFMARLGQATRYQVSKVKAGWFYTSLYGYMTAAAVTGKLLGFDEEKMTNAIGLAYQKTAGNQQAVIDGALAKRMAPGFAASGGLLAALMAGKGITGAKNCIEGEYGLYNIYHHGVFDKNTFMAGLGKEFKGKNPVIKRYPACRITHPYIDATLALINENNIQPEDVKEVTIFGGEAGSSLILPLDVKTNPRNPVDAQFSVPWTVATAIVKRRFSIGDITDKAITDSRVKEMTQKIKYQKDPAMVRHGLEPGKVQILTDRGSFVKQVEYPEGEAGEWMDFNTCVKKFRECALNARHPLSNEVTEQIVQSILNFEKLEDVRPIIKAIG